MTTSVHRRLRGAALALALLLVGCDGLLDVDTSGVLTPDDLDAAGPSSIVPIVNGVIHTYQEAVDDVVRYAALLTDEMISAGSFDTRLQVDRRRRQPSNPTITGAMYTPLHQARHLADTTYLVLQSRLSDPDYGTVTSNLRAGMALSKLYGGYSRLWLGELYCWSILTGTHPETSPQLPNARVRQGLQVLREAEAAATAIGFERVRMAALVGQARAHLWLREYDLAAAVAARVPREFRHEAEYSQNTVSQYNEVYSGTWGDADAIAWTVGAGDQQSRGNEKWAHFEEFVGLNLISPDAPLVSQGRLPVNLQMIYQRQDSEILIGSGIEAQLIRAEVAVRAGQTAAAQALLNDLRADYSLRVLLHSKVELPTAGNTLQPLTLSGVVATDLSTVAAERARELWLTGDRLTTSRRMRADPLQIDLFPPVKTLSGGGDDTAFPIPQLELDANPHLSSAQACPAGQSMGSWR